MSQQLITACALVAGLIGAGAALIRATVWLWHMLRKLARLADDLTGEPPRGQDPGRPGVLDRLAAIEKTDAEHLDVLNGVGTRLTSIEERLSDQDEIKARLAAVEAALMPQTLGPDVP